jgi:predicted O-methyltransferase YrrM
MATNDVERDLREIEDAIAARRFTLREGSASIEEIRFLSSVAQQRNAMVVGETGFHTGSSSIAFLKAGPKVTVVSFDIGRYGYVMLAKEIIDGKFPGRHTLIYGNSRKTVPAFKKSNPELRFDLVFIDGGHSYRVAKADIENMKLFATRDTRIIMDDLTPWLPWGKGPTRAWTEVIRNGLVVQEKLFKDGKLVAKIEPPGERSWALGRYVLD